MSDHEKVNILLVDDQPAKLLAYEVILNELGENLIKAGSGRAALEHLLKTDVGVVLVDVSMPDLDGFQLVSMIREHPRYEKTAIIFVSAIHLSEIDTVKGYAKGAVDYVSVPVIPEILRAKVRVFADLYRKTRLLERLNSELEQRVEERTAELTAALDRQAILAREVDHRAKNALAVVQSILHLTRANDVRSYVASVEGRIHALSRAHDLLSQSRWEGANLSRLIEEELEPYQTQDENRIGTRGPRVVLQPAVAQTLALALHELATNAAKYGALSVPAGRVMVEWDLNPTSLSLTWTESNGPAVARPAAQGFGTKLIRLSMEGQLNGKVDFDWRPSGLFCLITIARDEHAAPLADNRSADATSDRSRPTDREEPARRRVLVVEDEALVAMMMVGLVEELGFIPCGPFANVNEAAAAVRSGSCDGAVLDVNLGGELVYPVADLLSNLGVPFVFVTGYSAELVDKRFTNIPILQKPVQMLDLEQAFVEWGFLAGDQQGSFIPAAATQ
jgi:two-component sensor histidine kinase